jgi:hypothetical protein
MKIASLVVGIPLGLVFIASGTVVLFLVWAERTAFRQFLISPRPSETQTAKTPASTPSPERLH